MAPPRPYWKSYLKLSLVSCPVAVYSAISSGERVAFKQINRQTGHRLKQQLVDEHTGDLVETAEKARGYEVGKGDYMLVEDDELEAVAIESQHTIDIDRFVPRAEIDERYLMLQLAEHILESKSGDFEPATFADRYEEAVVAMLRTKQSGRTVSTAEPRFKDEKVFDLMDALRRSIAGTPKPAEVLGKKTKAKLAKKRIEGQREMLLPISGKKAAEVKPVAKPTKALAKRKAG